MPNPQPNVGFRRYEKPDAETLMLTDHSGREHVYHSLDHATEVVRDIGFDSVRVEEHF
ncbi:MAG: hypothetical protein G8D88_03215 [gamma proteobacterium symbiont of Ctena orbiculata]